MLPAARTYARAFAWGDDMYAVIKVGGKQYRVTEGQTLLVDRQPYEPGEGFSPEVLMTADGGAPVTDRGALGDVVGAKVVEHLRGEKLRIFTYKPKRGEKRMRGHRSELTRISIERVGKAPARRTRAAAKEKEAATDGA
jgi:large subunit ribosomal protein L21